MDAITLQSAANVALFIAPGYVALRTYAAIYAKKDKDFSHLLVESIAVSLLIVALVDWLWRLVMKASPVSTNTVYIGSLFLTTFVLSVLFAKVRVLWPLKQLLEKLGFGTPDEDFIRAQFFSLKRNGAVSVTLKSGEIFSGTPTSGSIFSQNSPREYRFNNIAWYNQDSKSWEERPGSIIVNLNEVNYLELAS